MLILVKMAGFVVAAMVKPNCPIEAKIIKNWGKDTHNGKHEHGQFFCLLIWD